MRKLLIFGEIELRESCQCGSSTSRFRVCPHFFPEGASVNSEALRCRSLPSKCGLMDLAALLKLNEGKTLEFKRDLSSPEGALKCLVAFANTAGGTLIVGIEDGTKHVKEFRTCWAPKKSWPI